MEENRYYVYGYIRLDINSYFYIGKGSGRRCFDIWNRSGYFLNILDKVPCVVEILYDNLTEDEAFYYEEKTIEDLVFNEGYSISIKNIKRNNEQHLANRCWGGGTNNGYHHTPESKEKLSKAHTGKHLSEETKRKLSEINSGENHPKYGTKHSEETRRRISKSLTGKKFPEDRKRRLSEAHKGIPNLANRKRVKCIELDREFNSITEAEEYMKKYYGYKALHIADVCNKKRPYSGKLKNGIKLHWEWIENYKYTLATTEQEDTL